MQLSLDPARDPSCVTITIRNDTVNDRTMLQVVVSNRAGGVLGSVGKYLVTDGEAELLPQLLHLVALNWLYVDTRAILRDVTALVSDYRRTAKAPQP